MGRLLAHSLNRSLEEREREKDLATTTYTSTSPIFIHLSNICMSSAYYEFNNAVSAGRAFQSVSTYMVKMHFIGMLACWLPDCEHC